MKHWDLRNRFCEVPSRMQNITTGLLGRGADRRPRAARGWISRVLAALLPLLFGPQPFPATATAGELRLGIIGLDTSHATAFTQLLNTTNHPNHVPGGRVVAAFRGGSPDIPSSISRVDGYARELQEKYGVVLVDSIEALCQQVDAVLLESVDGRPHLAQVKPVLAARKPVFIDKPMAGSLKDVVEIFRIARQQNVPCFSSSSLRYYPGLIELKSADVGAIKGAVSTGPSPLEPHHPDLFWYGIHPTEALYAVLGTGCERVVRSSAPDTDVVTGVWKDGRIGTLIGIREGAAPYRVTLFGTKSVLDQKPGGDYAPLVREIMKFFQTGIAPVTPQETTELFAFMEAADESKRRGGAPVHLREVLDRAGASVAATASAAATTIQYQWVLGSPRPASP